MGELIISIFVLVSTDIVLIGIADTEISSDKIKPFRWYQLKVKYIKCFVMSEEKKVLEYDEDDSLKFIQEHLPEEMKNEFSDDEINYIVDLVYEFYEEKGFLDEGDDTEIEIDEDELLEYIFKNARKDAIRDYTDEQIEAIVAGELAYCDTLNLFDWQDIQIYQQKHK